MDRRFSLLIIFTVLLIIIPLHGLRSQQNKDKKWSDYTQEERDEIREKLIRKYNYENIKIRRRADYTDIEKEQFRDRWTHVQAELVAESLRFGDNLPIFVKKIQFPEKDNKLLKELGVTSFHN